MFARLAWLLVSLACLILVAGGQPISADGAQKEGQIQPDEAVHLVTSAASLIEYGRKTKSPEALIAAAGMLKRVPPSSLLKLEADDDQEAAKAGAGELPSLREEADALLVEAKKMSSNDPVVVAMADAVGNRKVSRGAVGGPRLVQNILPGKSHHSFKVPVVGGVPLAVGVTSAGNVLLRVKMRYTTKGASIQVADGYGIVGGRAFVPPANGTVTIQINNPTKAPTAYRVITN